MPKPVVKPQPSGDVTVKLPGYKKLAVERKRRPVADSNPALASSSLQRMQMKYQRSVSDPAAAFAAKDSARPRKHARTVTYVPENVPADSDTQNTGQNRQFIVKDGKVILERG